MQRRHKAERGRVNVAWLVSDGSQAGGPHSLLIVHLVNIHKFLLHLLVLIKRLEAQVLGGGRLLRI